MMMQPVPASPGPTLPCTRERRGFAVAGATRGAAGGRLVSPRNSETSEGHAPANRDSGMERSAQ